MRFWGICALACAVHCAAPGLASNLILNPGFEFPDLVPPDNQAPGADDWTTFNTAGVRTIFQQAGDQSLRLAPNAPSGIGDGIARQVFPAAANETYSFGVWVFHPSSAPITGDRKAQLRLQWLNVNNTLINQQILNILDANSPTDVWMFVALESVVLPDNPNITQLRPSLFVTNDGGTGGGAAFFDEAILVAGSLLRGPRVQAQIPSNPATMNTIVGPPIADVRYVFDQGVLVDEFDITIVDDQMNSVPFALTVISPQEIEIAFVGALSFDSYTISLADTIVSTSTALSLDGDQDGLAGGDAIFGLTHDSGADLDFDGDVDLLDFGEFQLSFTGPQP